MIDRRKFLNTSGLGLGAAYLATSSRLIAAEPERDAVLAPPEGPFASPTPHYIFAETLEEQEAQLRRNPLMLRFAAGRQQLSADRYRPSYHFISPDGVSNDPNGFCFWQGRWHLFYQAYPDDEFPDPKDMGIRRAHWGHAVSEDLVHWRDLPYALYPGIEERCFSAGAVADSKGVTTFYPGVGIGKPVDDTPGLLFAQMVATSSDPLLLNWEKTGPLDTISGDSDIWKRGETYYGLVRTVDKYYPSSDARVLAKDIHSTKFGIGVWPSWVLYSSRNLKEWTSEGDFLFEKTPLTGRFNDGSCPNFRKIGDKHIMIFFSHLNGGQYLLGDYDEVAGKFRPYDHGRFNHGSVGPGSVWAPSATATADGAVVNILSIASGIETDSWNQNQIMSLPQRLTLGSDKRLRIEPAAELMALRRDPISIGQVVIPAGKDMVFDTIRGNALELNVEIDPGQSRWVRLSVLRSPDGGEETAIIFYSMTGPFASGDKIVLDGSKSTTREDVALIPPEQADIVRGGETLKLRVFVDRSVVEVFVNERQYLAMRVYPGRKDSIGVSLHAHGKQAVLKKLEAWRMKPIWSD